MITQVYVVICQVCDRRLGFYEEYGTALVVLSRHEREHTAEHEQVAGLTCCVAVISNRPKSVKRSA